MQEASWAAAGMLAAEDPENPPVLTPLSQLSRTLYPAFLARIESLSGISVALRTSKTLQQMHISTATELSLLNAAQLAQLAPGLVPGHRPWICLQEHSLDPRDLCQALPKASAAVGNEMLEYTPWLSIESGNLPLDGSKVRLQTASTTILADTFVLCTGAWAGQSSLLPGTVSPVKGQMLCIAQPSNLDLRHTIRTPEIYIVPRGDGRIILGATVEPSGFEKSTDEATLQSLLNQAAAVVPALAGATILDSWSGLRPGTADKLPVLGHIPNQPNVFVASGHYRNGILLAPATAHVMAQLICGETPSVELAPFSPERHLQTIESTAIPARA